MKLWVGGLVASIIVAACTDETEGTACADISGNYETQSVRLSGTCDASLDGDGKSTLTISRSGADWSLVSAGIRGGCPAKLDASCKLTASCEIVDKDGKLLVTSSVEYTFSNGTFTGSSIGSVAPPVVEKACTANYRDNGKKL